MELSWRLFEFLVITRQTKFNRDYFIMKLFRASLLIAIIFILNIMSTFAGTIADDDELKDEMEMFSRAIGLADAMASNCSNGEALSRVKIVRTRGLERFAEAGFPQKSVEKFDDFIQKRIQTENEKIGTKCDENSLKTFMRGMETDYKLLEDILSRYVVPQ